MDANRQAPVIGITSDLSSTGVTKCQVSINYVNMVDRAGGVPIILPCVPEQARAYLELCDGLIFTGGDDPITTDPRLGGVPLHPKSNPVHPQRQAFELALLDALQIQREMPALGICLGMQMMGLHAGGTIDQHLADHLATADEHWDKHTHTVSGELASRGGVVNSHHRQALTSTGSMRVVATSPDGVIEAIRRDDRDFYLGVQWHPERTQDESLGIDLFRQLVNAAKTARKHG